MLEPNDLKACLGALEQVLSRRPEIYSRVEASRIANLVEEVTSAPLRISVVGPFSSGKSSIINRLIERDLLPTSIQETTATTFELRVVEDAASECLTLPDGARVGLDEIASVNTSERQNIKVLVASAALPAGFEVIDTPGLSSAFEIHERITREAIDRADVLLLVLDAKQGVTRAVLDFLKAHPGYASKTFVLLNKSDLLAEADRSEVLKHNTQACESLKPAGVLLTSAVARGGLDELRRVLVHDLPGKAERIKVETAQKRLVALGRNLLSLLEELRSAIRLDVRGLDERIAQETARREAVLRTVDRRVTELYADVKRECRHAVVSFERQAMALVDVWADRISQGSPPLGFSDELRRIWENETQTVTTRLEKLLGDFRADIEGVVVDARVEVPWWTNWIDWVTAGLAMLGPLTGGWANLIEGVVGKLFGAELKRGIVKRLARSALQSAVTEWVMQVSRHMETRLADLKADSERHVHTEIEPQLREVEEALKDLKSQREKETFNFEKACQELDEDIRRVREKLAVLGDG